MGDDSLCYFCSMRLSDSIEDTLLLSDKPISRYSFYPDSLNGFQAHFSLCQQTPTRLIHLLIQFMLDERVKESIYLMLVN